MAARRRRRPADGQGPARSRLHLHHGKVPAHPPRGRRPGPGCVQQDPQPRTWTNRVNPPTRRTALYAIAAIAIAASVNALAHSYAGLYAWALHHRLTGWQAVSWPAEIDVFLAVGELALYVAYLDGWPARQRIWPWMTTLVGLIVSVAGNVGHIQPLPGQPVLLVDRLTAAASPLAAFAGLTVGLLVLRMNRQHATTGSAPSTVGHLYPVPPTQE